MAGLDHDVVPRDRYPGRRPGAWRIPVASGDGDLESFIDQAIAVIIQCVEDLGSAGFDGRIAVVAIGIISHVTQGLRDGILRYQGISKSIAVGIRIPGCARRGTCGNSKYVIGLPKISVVRRCGGGSRMSMGTCDLQHTVKR